MSGRKNNLPVYQIITSTAMTANITSAVTNVQWLDNIGIQLNFTGNPTGTFAVQVSADYAQDTLGNVTNSGNWVSLSLSPSPAASGSANSIYIDINQTSAPWMRVTYTDTFVATGNIATIADSSGSLNNKYFLIDGADGGKWCVWFNVSSGGVAPSVSGYTNVEVDISTNDSANTVATALRTALAAVTSITSIGGSTNHATFSSAVAGAITMTDTGGTGFTLTITNTTGVLNGYITAKMI